MTDPHFASMLIHTCERQRTGQSQSADNEVYYDWSSPTIATLECRYSQRRQRYASEQQSSEVLTETRLYLLPDADVTTLDRIANVKDASNNVIATGPFDVLEVTPKFDGGSKHHLELRLERTA